MTIQIFPLKYYTQSGNLNPPTYFYVGLLFLARTWAILIISLATQETGSKLLAFFYPDKNHFYLGLVSGLIALILFFLAGRDHDKYQLVRALWKRGYPLLLISICLDMLLQLYFLYIEQFKYSIEASIQLVFIIWLLLYCLRSRHLKASFKRSN